MKQIKNKRGFTLIELLAIIIILGVILTIAVVSYASHINHSKAEYFTTAEQSMIAAAEGMYTFCNNATPTVLEENNYCDYILDKVSPWTISLKTLEENEYMEHVSDITGKGNCDLDNSYVRVDIDDSNINTKLKYDVCLRCGDYKTKASNKTGTGCENE